MGRACADMAAEIEKGNIEQSKREQMDADLIAEYRMSSIEDDIKSRIASDMESELSKGELEDNFKARLARVLSPQNLHCMPCLLHCSCWAAGSGTCSSKAH